MDNSNTQKCPNCGAKEIEAASPRTFYECGSSDYDGRPGTFSQTKACRINIDEFFSEESLKMSEEFKIHVTGKIALIHNTYYDSDEHDAAYIVLHSHDDISWTITRFFKLGKKIRASNDYVGIPTAEVFAQLLSQYSRGLA